MKRANCASHVATMATVDLYLNPAENAPTRPPTGPPTPGTPCPVYVPSSAASPLFRVVHGVDVADASIGSKALCVAGTTVQSALLGICAALDACAGFTVGSEGSRGSVLYTAAELAPGALAPDPGVDLFLLGPGPATANESTVTPKPARTSVSPDPATGKAAVVIDPAKFMIAGPAGAGPVLTAGMARYLGGGKSYPGAGLLFVGNERRTDRGPSMAAPCTRLAVRVDDLGEDGPHQGDDESYTLAVSASTASLASGTVWGALRGLETLAQLLSVGVGTPGLYFADVQRVEDAPQYPYRGLMVDTARLYLPTEVLLATLDGMAIEKLNVLHWHSVDDQSFPMPVPSLPELQAAGPYGA